MAISTVSGLVNLNQSMLGSLTVSHLDHRTQNSQFFQPFSLRRYWSRRSLRLQSGSLRPQSRKPA